MFDKICDFTVDPGSPNSPYITEYKSPRSGVRVVIVDVQSPTFELYMTFPTEATDHAGAPHCLEHLVFLGSKQYPFKGVLDKMSTRCLAEGTNAWTDTDHTTYTFFSASHQGLLNLLPVYLDHLLRPTMSEEAFVTEIHHIDENGVDGGVVYSEMQARENTSQSMVERVLYENIYKGTNYIWETGGMLQGIRDLTNDSLKEFHAKHYSWSNLSIVVAGSVDHASLLEAVGKAEETIGHMDTTPKPWADASTAVLPEAHKLEKVLFPADDESTGSISFGMRGPEWGDFQTRDALETLGEYLTESNAAPLTETFVDAPRPLASHVGVHAFSHKTTGMVVTLYDVPVDKMGRIMGLLKKTLKIAHDKFDIVRMKEVIQSSIFDLRHSCENNAAPALIQGLNEFFVNGTEPDQLKGSVDRISSRLRLLTKDAEYWKALLLTWIIDPPSIEVRAIPSKRAGDLFKESEHERIETRKTEYGPQKMLQLTQALEHARHFVLLPPPMDVINSMPLCSIRDIKLLDFPLYRNFTFNGFDATPASVLPLDGFSNPCQILDIPSNFIYSHIVCRINPEDTEVLPLMAAAFFSIDTTYDGMLMSYEKFSRLLAAHTIDYDASIGFRGAPYKADTSTDYFVINLSSPVQRFKEFVKILTALRSGLNFGSKRLQIVARNLLAIAPKKARSGRFLLGQLTAKILYDDEAIINKCGLVPQVSFLKKFIQKPSAYMDQIKKAYERLFEKCFTSFSFHNSKAPPKWDELLRGAVRGPCGVNQKIDFRAYMGHSEFENTELVKNMKERRNCICASIRSSDSSYLAFTGGTRLRYGDPEAARVALGTEYVSVLEGPLYNAARGNGLSYGVALSHNANVGVLSLRIHPAADAVTALTRCLNELKSHKYDQASVDAAKLSLAYSIVESEESMEQFAATLIEGLFKGFHMPIGRWTLNNIDVSAGTVERSMKDALTSMLSFKGFGEDQPGDCLVIVAPESKLEDVRTKLNTICEPDYLGHREMLGYLGDEAVLDGVSADSGSDDEEDE